MLHLIAEQNIVMVNQMSRKIRRVECFEIANSSCLSFNKTIELQRITLFEMMAIITRN